MMRGILHDRVLYNRLIPPITQILWFISMMFFLLMIFSMIMELVHLSQRKSTNGKVISYVESEITNRFHPKITFIDMKGNIHEFVDGTGATAPLYLVGTTVQVDYHPQYPAIAEMTTLYYRWGGSIGLFFLSVIFWMLGSRFTYMVRS